MRQNDGRTGFRSAVLVGDLQGLAADQLERRRSGSLIWLLRVRHEWPSCGATESCSATKSRDEVSPSHERSSLRQLIAFHVA